MISNMVKSDMSSTETLQTFFREMKIKDLSPFFIADTPNQKTMTVPNVVEISPSCLLLHMATKIRDCQTLFCIDLKILELNLLGL